MKILISTARGKRGSALLVAMILCSVLALSVAGYLSLVEQQTVLSSRSQSWNTAMAVVEAGIEEGLQHLNSNRTNLNVDGWWRVGNVYWMARTLADNSRYWVAIDAATDPASPTITARAYVSQQLYVENVPPSFFATVGFTPPSQNFATRAVRVTCSKGNLFTAAVVAKHSIDLRGNGVYSDSYDSSDPAKSTNGRYDASNYSGDLGDIASIGGILDSVSVQNANIYGKVHTGPEVPVSVGSQGAVGTHAWQASNKGFQPGYVLQDANFTFPDTRLPRTTGLLPPASGTVITTSYTYSTNSVTTFTYPDPVPAVVATNVSYQTSTTCPSPTPEWVTINNTCVTNSTCPNPVPAGIVTNIYTTSVTASTYPAAGTYLGGVTTNEGKNKNFPDTYTYQKITSIKYLYQTQTYTFASTNYTYDTTITTPSYTTNYYANIVEGGQTNVAASLTGTTLIRGPKACLVLPNGLTGSENIQLENGASLVIYAGGTSVSISGNQALNPTGFAGNFIVLCAPSVTDFTLNGNGEFTGVLVAPEADVKMNGSGNSDQDFCGAFVCNSLRLNGHFSFHYDEALGKGPSTGRFLITSWDEIP